MLMMLSAEFENMNRVGVLGHWRTPLDFLFIFCNMHKARLCYIAAPLSREDSPLFRKKDHPFGGVSGCTL